MFKWISYGKIGLAVGGGGAMEDGKEMGFSSSGFGGSCSAFLFLFTYPQLSTLCLWYGEKVTYCHTDGVSPVGS
jgi:hypothetical protein